MGNSLAKKPWMLLCFLFLSSGGQDRSSAPPALKSLTDEAPDVSNLKAEQDKSHFLLPAAPLGIVTKEDEIRNFFGEKRYDEALNVIAAELKRLDANHGDLSYREWLERQKWILKTAQAWVYLEKQNCSQGAPLLQEIPSDKLPEIALKGLGYCKLLNRDWTDAEAYLSRYIQNQKTDPEAVQLLARVKESQGLYEEALDLTKSLESMPETGVAKLDLEPMKKSLMAKQDESERQLLLESGFFRVHYQPNLTLEFIEKVVETMNRTATKLNMDFGIDYPSHIVDISFHSLERFGEITHSPDWAAGIYDGQIRLPIGEEGLWSEEIERAIRHELAHALLAEMVQRRNLPTWFQEGFAQMAECETLCLHYEYVATTRPFLPINRFDETFMSMQARDAQVAYKQSFYMMLLLNRHQKDANMRQMFALLPELENLSSKDIVEQSAWTFAELHQYAKQAWQGQLSF